MTVDRSPIIRRIELITVRATWAQSMAHAQSPRVHNYVTWLLRTRKSYRRLASGVGAAHELLPVVLCRDLEHGSCPEMSLRPCPEPMPRLFLTFLASHLIDCRFPRCFAPPVIYFLRPWATTESTMHASRSFTLDDHVCGYPTQLRVPSSVKPGSI